MTRFFAALILFSPLAFSRAQEPTVDPYDQSQVSLEVEPPADYKGKRTLIVAGRKSHGPGDHEFFAGSAILVNLLKQNEGVFPIMAREGWPKNERLFETADCIVMYMDGRNGHPAVQGDRLDFLQKQMDRGAGWVNIHYAVDYLPKHGKRVMGWMGGYYEPDYSINPHWDAVIRSLPKHPITRGVKPFTLRDEWYYGMRFVEDTKGLTPILQALPPDGTRATAYTKGRKGEIETMAWAYERPDEARGRGFGQRDPVEREGRGPRGRREGRIRPRGPQQEPRPQRQRRVQTNPAAGEEVTRRME
jgi:hypothetical protein